MKKINKKQFGDKMKPAAKKPAPSPEPPRSERQDVAGMRLNKYIAHCGICSRRQAAELVKEGLITVNGEVQKEPGYQVQEEDVVMYEGKVIQPEERNIYILLNKPKDVISTVSDEKGRRTVIDLLKGKVKERIFPVGRLDRATTGLLLLTNDGPLAERMVHPRYQGKKVYNVTLDKPVTEEHLEAIRNTLELEDGPAPVNWIEYSSKKEENKVSIEIAIGRNRIVRRIFEHLGYDVQRLDRVYLCGLTKKDLPRGWWRHLTQQEVIMLKHFT